MPRAAGNTLLPALAALGALAVRVAAADVVPAAGPAPASPSPVGSSSGWSFGDSALMRSLGVGSWWDVFRPGTWETTLNIGGDGNLQQTQAPDAPEARYFSRVTTQGIFFRNQGFSLLDPRLFTGDFGVRFALDQARQDGDGTESTQNADVTDYFFDATVLQEMPYNVDLSAGHVEAVTSLAGGGSTASQSTSQRVGFNWGEDSFLRDRDILPYFSASLLADWQHLQQVTRSAGQSFKQDEQRNGFRLSGHNGFQTADLSFDLQDTDVQNHVYRAGSFHSQYANLTYDADFGDYLDRHSTSRLNYNRRDGDFGVSNLNFDQNLIVVHNEFLSSYYGYSLLRSESPAGKVTAQTGDAGALYSPFLNLTTDLSVNAARQSLDIGNIDTEGGYADATYNHGVPGGGQLTASLGSGLQYNSSHLQSQYVPAIDQPYQAPPQLGAGAGFVLKDSYVVTDSIIVVNVRDGGRLPTTVGVDYVVDVVGSRTTIVPLAGSVVIQPGDPLQVSYLHLVDPSLESKTTSRSVYLMADWQWIAVALTHNETRQTPLSGQEHTLLSDQDRTSLRVDLRHEWGAVETSANGTVSRYRDSSLKYDEQRIGGTITYRPNYYWMLGLHSTLTETSYISTPRQSTMFDAGCDASFNSVSGWWGSALLSYRTVSDSDLPSETSTEARVRVRRDFAKLDFSAALGLGERTRGGVRSTYADIHVSAIRRF